MSAEDKPSRFIRTKDSVINYINPRKPEHPAFTPIGEYYPGTPLENWAAHFSGHGAPQAPKMEDPLRQTPQVNRLYQEAETSLGLKLSELSQEQLFQTKYAQAAITLLNIASYYDHALAFPDELINEPDIVSSQSLGLVSAAWFAGIFGYRDDMNSAMVAVELAQTRGEIMQKACDPPFPDTGTMLIWAGDKRKKATSQELGALDLIRKQAKPRENDVSLALDISDARIVLGGKKEDLLNYHARAKKQFGELNINFYNLPTNSGAFHTKYMGVIQDEVRQMFENVKHLAYDPEIPLLTNSHEEPHLITTLDEFIEEMVRLCTEPVWGRGMAKYLTDRGIDTGLEFGQRGIIANSLDPEFFDKIPRSVWVAGTALTTGTAITTAILIKRRKDR